MVSCCYWCEKRSLAAAFGNNCGLCGLPLCASCQEDNELCPLCDQDLFELVKEDRGRERELDEWGRDGGGVGRDTAPSLVVVASVSGDLGHVAMPGSPAEAMRALLAFAALRLQALPRCVSLSWRDAPLATVAMSELCEAPVSERVVVAIVDEEWRSRLLVQGFSAWRSWWLDECTPPDLVASSDDEARDCPPTSESDWEAESASSVCVGEVRFDFKKDFREPPERS